MAKKNNGAQVITGTDSDDLLEGTLAGEKINGGDGDDVIIATGGDDRINAGDGDDFIIGGLGNDTIFGNEGFDTAVYEGSVLDYLTADGVLNISPGKGNSLIFDTNGLAGIDELKHIQALEFSDYTYYMDGRNNTPIALNDTAQTNEDTPVTGIDPLSNDLDLDGDTLSVIDAVSDAQALVTINIDSSLDYDPGGVFDYLAVGETAIDTILYTVTDGNGGSAQGQLVVNIAGVNDAPEAMDDFVVTDEDTVVSGNLLANDTDVDLSDTLSTIPEIGLAGSNGGTFTIDEEGNFVFDPGDDFQALGAGESTETAVAYQVTDGNGGMDTASLTVTITGLEDVSFENGGFETGLLGWDSIGSVRTAPSNSGAQPTEGNYMAVLTAYGAWENEIEAFWGVPSSSINAITPSATNGAAIRQEVALEAGQTVSFDWYFDAQDYIPFNDTSVFLNLGGSVRELADIYAVGSYGDSGWHTASMTAEESGVYLMGVAVVNDRDTALSSQLYVDNFVIV